MNICKVVQIEFLPMKIGDDSNIYLWILHLNSFFSSMTLRL